MKTIILNIILQLVCIFVVKFMWNEVVSDLIMAKKVDFIQAMGLCYFVAFIRLSGKMIVERVIPEE